MGQTCGDLVRAFSRSFHRNVILKGSFSCFRCKDSWEVVYPDSTAKSDSTGCLESGEGGGNASQTLAKEEPCYPCLLLTDHPGLQQEQSEERPRVHCSGDQALCPSKLTGTAPWSFLLLTWYDISPDVTGSWLGTISPKEPLVHPVHPPAAHVASLLLCVSTG